jgi:hypothetical protein
MSGQVQDHYSDDEFLSLIDSAGMNAANDWEENFVADLAEKYSQYGRRMYISESQMEHLERIADDE